MSPGSEQKTNKLSSDRSRHSDFDRELARSATVTTQNHEQVSPHTRSNVSASSFMSADGPQTRAPPIRAHSDSSEAAQRRRGRPGSARLSSKPSPFHNLLTARQRRRTFSGTSGEFGEQVDLENSTAKSVEVFRGEARGILHGIFLVLLLRFILALVVAVGTLGMAALLILMVKEPNASLTSYLLFYS